MSLDSKYNNYIYFSNSPDSIKVLSDDGKMVDIEVAAAGLGIGTGIGTALAASFGGSNLDFSFKLIGNNTKTFPPYPAGAFKFRKEDDVINRSSGINNLSVKFKGKSNKTRTNDPFLNPNTSYAFEQKGKAMKFIHKKHPRKYNINVPSDLDISTFGKNTFGYMDKVTAESLVITTLFDSVLSRDLNVNFNFLPNSLNADLKTTNTNGQFRFLQDDFARYLYRKTIGETGLETKIKDFFKGYHEYLTLSPGRGQIVDITTRFGVPFDFQTVMNNDTDAKIYGVKNTQPKYEKVYNYYDPQYESTVIDLLNANTNGIDERSLPSIYDFLYFPVQQNALKAIVGIPNFLMTEDNFSISNLNQYLDTYSVLYDKYLNSSFPVLENASFCGQYFYSPQQGGGPKIQPGNDGGEDISIPPQGEQNTGNENNQPNKAKIIKHINDSFGASADIINEKNNSVPVWVQELKTGMYFSEKSMRYFNQALQHDIAFPFFTKINIPTEGRGQITSLLSRYNLLDSLNSYMAALITPSAEVPAAKRTYSSFFGGLINGLEEQTKQFNIYAQLNLQTFKLHFYKKPTSDEPERILIQPSAAESALQTAEDIIEQGTLADVNLDTSNQIATEGGLKSTGKPGQSVGAGGAFDFDGYFASQPDQTGPTVNVGAATAGGTLAGVAGGIEAIRLPGAGGIQAGAATGIGAGGMMGIASSAAAAAGLLGGGSSTPSFTGGSAAQSAMQTAEDAIAAGPVVQEELAAVATTVANIIEDQFLEIPFDIQMPEQEVVLGQKNVFYDSDLFIDTFQDATVGQDVDRVFTYTDEPEKLVFDNEGFAGLIEQLKADLFAQDLKKMLFDKGLLRSPRQIRDGKFAHQETLMYEIAKYSVGDTGAETYIQSIFLPQAEQDNLSFYDTQIVPYKNYFYKIFTHKVIVGTKYSITPYSNGDIVSLKTTDVYSDILNIKYSVEPVLQFVRVPYYNTEEVNLKVDKLNYTRVEDKPPMPPEVEIVPFRDVNDQILILLSVGTGEMEAYPKIIFEEEREMFEDVALSQDRVGDKAKKIMFASDDQLGTYQIYRTLNPPSDYTDIAADNTLVEYSPEHDYLFDSIKPNVTYYYTFRFVDIHGKISNPTDIYKVKMVQSTGLPPYLKVDLINLAEIKKIKNEEKFSATKQMTKYLMIKPNDLQNTVEYPNLEYDSEGNPIGDPRTVKVKVGNDSGPSIFGNKYKLRVTSKQTGKKIDINFTVKNPQDIINDI